ncbi:MAG: H(+)/Cl(-) exchange transporter ClcA, partial [Pseudomonadota bacterium]
MPTPLKESTLSQHESHRFFVLNQKRRLLLPKSIMVGLLTGLVAVVFHLSLDYGEAFRNHLIEQAHQYGRQGIFIVIGFTALCVFVAAFLVKHYAPEAGGSGIP